MRKAPMRKLVAALAVTALFVTGCGGGSGSHPKTAQQSTPSAVLATAGIATVADEKSTTPLVPVSGPTVLELTSWQVQNMATEAAGGGGILGSDLNRILPMPPRAPQADDIIGGWLLAKADPAQNAAFQLIGNQSWTAPDEVIFPTEVLTLFVADLVGHDLTQSSSGSAAASPTAATDGAIFEGRSTTAGDASLADKPCSAVSDFVTGVLDKIFSTLKLDPATVGAFVSGAVGGGALGTALGTAAGFIASWWDRAVDLAEQAVKDALKNLIQPFVNALAVVVGGLATIAIIKSYLKAWTATVTPKPTSNRFGVGSDGQSGSLTVAINTGALTADWPDVIVDCAKAADLRLPELSRPGAPAKWTIVQPEPLVTSTDLAGPLDKDLKETVDYTTGTESVHLATTGQPVSPVATFKVKVNRTEIEQLRDFVKSYLAGKLPTPIAPIVTPILNSYIDLAVNWLGDLVAVTGGERVVIMHHIPKPVPGCTPSGDTIPPGRYSGTFTATLHVRLQTAGQLRASGSGTTVGHGVVTIVSNGQTVTGTMKITASGSSKLNLGPSGLNDSFNGGLSVKISGPASSPTVAGIAKSVSAVAGPLSSPFHAGLHVTGADCSSVSGDVVAMEDDAYAPLKSEVHITGSGLWNAPRTN
jgi:hypothetical protein